MSNARSELNLCQLLIVHGICASSCANYLFLAGQTKILDHGIVGFHGNWKAMAASENFKKQASAVEPKLRAKLLALHARKVEQETEFLSMTGADQKLFDKTQKENEDGLYDVYLPGPQMFESYGVHGVIGAQDRDILKSWPSLKVLVDNGSSQIEDTAACGCQLTELRLVPIPFSKIQ